MAAGSPSLGGQRGSGCRRWACWPGRPCNPELPEHGSRHDVFGGLDPLYDTTGPDIWRATSVKAQNMTSGDPNLLLIIPCPCQTVSMAPWCVLTSWTVPGDPMPASMGSSLAYGLICATSSVVIHQQYIIGSDTSAAKRDPRNVVPDALLGARATQHSTDGILIAGGQGQSTK